MSDLGEERAIMKDEILNVMTKSLRVEEEQACCHIATNKVDIEFHIFRAVYHSSIELQSFITVKYQSRIERVITFSYCL